MYTEEEATRLYNREMKKRADIELDPQIAEIEQWAENQGKEFAYYEDGWKLRDKPPALPKWQADEILRLLKTVRPPMENSINTSWRKYDVSEPFRTSLYEIRTTICVIDSDGETIVTSGGYNKASSIILSDQESLQIALLRLAKHLQDIEPPAADGHYIPDDDSLGDLDDHPF